MVSQFDILLSSVEAAGYRMQAQLEGSHFPDAVDWDIHGLRLNLDLRGSLHSGVYVFLVRLSGEIQMPCDRCLRLFWLPLTFEGSLHVRRDAVADLVIDGDEWLINSNTTHLDLRPYLRDSIYLSLPMRHYHGQYSNSDSGQCDAGMIDFIKHSTGDALVSSLDSGSLSALSSYRDMLAKGGLEQKK